MKLQFSKKSFFMLGIILAIAIICTPVFSQSPPPVKNSNESLYGNCKDGIYANKYFGFSFAVPSDFTVMETDEAKLYARAGVDILKKDSTGKAMRIDDAVANQATLVGILQKPFGSPQNAILEIVVRKQATGVTANMALAASTSLMTSSAGFKVSKLIDDARFGGVKFAGVKMNREFNSINLTEELYTIMRHNYAVYFGVTYSTEDGRKKIIKLLESIEFVK